MSASIETHISELRAVTNAARLNHGIWWAYKSVETRPLYVDTMNDYLLFFHTGIHAHFVAMIVALYSLYETRRDTINIPAFLRLLKEEGAVGAEFDSRLSSLFEEAKPLWVKVGILRNEAFGHRSNESAISDAFEKAKITPDQLLELIKKTETLLNTATVARNGESHAFNLSSREDALRVLETLKRAGGG